MTNGLFQHITADESTCIQWAKEEFISIVKDSKNENSRVSPLSVYLYTLNPIALRTYRVLAVLSAIVLTVK